MSPPLTIEPDEIQLIASTIGEALDAVLSARGAAH
jgi:adenosylmethionine-8-amino-7-oxononanoate aminotransferase